MSDVLLQMMSSQERDVGPSLRVTKSTFKARLGWLVSMYGEDALVKCEAIPGEDGKPDSYSVVIVKP